jgi:lysozyme family protein
VPSPYLCSFTDQYSRGKYVADGKYDAAAVSKQCGAAALMKQLLI